jgi:dipeptidyl-peptidase III
VSEEEWNQFLVYSAAVFNNCGNFKSFGDTKFVPQLSEARFKTIIKSSKNYKDERYA